MAHFSLVDHRASDSLAHGELQRERQKYEVCDHPSAAKQSRLSRPNTIEEIRRKRSKRRRKNRQEERKLSAKALKRKLSEKFRSNLREVNGKFAEELQAEKNRADENRKKAEHFWREWRKGKSLKQKEILLHQIDQNNLKDLHAPGEEILGRGVFGICKKKSFRGHTVAVKFFNKKMSAEAVKKEAGMMNIFDHNGLPYIFGVNAVSRPYFIVMECYGINGKTVTLAEAAKTKLFSTEKEWAGTLKMCAESIHHLHEKDFIHCDLKGDNIVINEINGKYFPVVIDFGKMKKTSEAKLKTLSSKEKEKYAKSHRHIAPEVVEGTHPPTKASDVYAFGLIISLICFYRKIESLRLIAFLCINGNPERRPTVHQIIEKFQEILK